MLRVAVDNTTPLGYGLSVRSTCSSTTARCSGSSRCAVAARSRRVVRRLPTPLRSGWAWGQQYLEGGVAVVDATVGKGRVLLFGPEITYRAQPHGTFKFLFNGIYYATAEPATIGAR